MTAGTETTGGAAVFVATCDLVGQVRGRGVAPGAADSVLRSGVGWVPANLALTAFGGIAPDNVFGSTGDLRLVPDETTEITMPTGPAGADRSGNGDLRLYLADQTSLDGTAWECCPRAFLRSAIEDLERSFGLHARVSFEHEFVIPGCPPAAPFSLRRHRDVGNFGDQLLRGLAGAGLEPENWLPEYGEGQFEITVAPTDALRAADRAIWLRELVRDLAAEQGMRASFAPLQDVAGTGSGVHVHLSLVDSAGNPVLFDETRPGRLSEVGGRFATGIVTHARALAALTAPSAASYFRLLPHRWSVGAAFLAERNREALVRICPTSSLGATPCERQFNLEYRAADATANPWLVLGALLRAGMAGLVGDPGDTVRVWEENANAADLEGLPGLPRSLDEALAALQDDDVARSWLHPDMLATYLAVKRSELDHLAGMTDAEMVTAVADVY